MEKPINTPPARLKDWRRFVSEPDRLSFFAPGKESGAKDVFRFISKEDYERIQRQAMYAIVAEIADIQEACSKTARDTGCVSRANLLKQLADGFKVYAEAQLLKWHETPDCPDNPDQGATDH